MSFKCITFALQSLYWLYVRANTANDDFGEALGAFPNLCMCSKYVRWSHWLDLWIWVLEHWNTYRNHKGLEALILPISLKLTASKFPSGSLHIALLAVWGLEEIHYYNNIVTTAGDVYQMELIKYMKHVELFRNKGITAFQHSLLGYIHCIKHKMLWVYRMYLEFSVYSVKYRS